MLDRLLRDPVRGWALGSDAAIADVHLASDRSTGISGCHLRIQHNWDHGTLILQCSSDRGMRFKPTSSNKWTQLQATSRKTRSATTSEQSVQQQMLEAESDTLIELGSLDLRIEIPDRGPLEPQFQYNLNRYHEKHILQATPNLSALQVKGPCSDGTPVVRRVRGVIATYLIGIKIGSGSSSLVHQVRDVQTGNAFAAKFFTTNNVLRRQREIHILQKLSHVRPCLNSQIVAPSRN